MRYILAVLLHPYSNQGRVKILYDTSVWDAYNRFTPETHALLELKDITDLTIEEVEEYCERYKLCVLW